MARKKQVLNLPDSPDLTHEQEIWGLQFGPIAGLDEAGRGAWAGPVSAAAVILPMQDGLCQVLSGVRDSKQMTAKKRVHWAVIIRQQALAWGVGFASHEEIDQQGIIAATRLAMARAIQELSLPPVHLLIDALRLPQINLQQTALIKGDRRSLSIAAASILAKTSRDALMQEQDVFYPGYYFGQHKGYGTRRHQLALSELGPCPIHRLSFKPLREGLWSQENYIKNTE
jgi:ribonuclease HII